MRIACFFSFFLLGRVLWASLQWACSWKAGPGPYTPVPVACTYHWNHVQMCLFQGQHSCQILGRSWPTLLCNRHCPCGQRWQDRTWFSQLLSGIFKGHAKMLGRKTPHWWSMGAKPTISTSSPNLAGNSINCPGYWGLPWGMWSVSSYVSPFTFHFPLCFESPELWN